MLVQRVAGATRNLGAPRDWKPENGVCGGLPIRDEPAPGGGNVMISCWQPTPEEVELLKSGAPVYLHVWGVGHPPVALIVGNPPDEGGG